MSRRRASIAMFAASLAVAAALAGGVAAHDPDPTMPGGPMTQDIDLHYRWGSGGTPPAAIRTAITAAAGDSNASKRSRGPTFTYDSTGTNAIYYGVDVPCGVNGLACMRRDTPDWFGVWLRENGHRYDWGTLRWCELSGADGCYEAENITLDELGHILGLDHHVNYADDRDYLDAVVQTYARAKPRQGWDAHAFGRCDVASLQQLYDMQTSWVLYSTCLDLPTTTTLAASRTTVTSGAMVTFTASLRSAGTGRLSNNGMSGRTVVLQQRSGTSWADVMTFTPGSGVGAYSASVTVRTGGDYRALFRKPSAEGALTSASGAITITATAGCTKAPCPLAHPGPGR